MLKLKNKHHLDFPHLTFSMPHSMQLSPVTDDDDELTAAIVHDPIDHDDDWELVERPDTNELESYWEKVERDVRNDPEWLKVDEPDNTFLS